MNEQESATIEYGTFEASIERSRRLEIDLSANPSRHRMLTGDRPTGRLHIGHLFGSVQNRVRLQNLGIDVFVVIADYQVLTDRDSAASIAENVRELTLDYLACGLDPERGKTTIFAHSHVPELNQLLLPFLTLVTMAELDRNPTVKEEIQAAGLTRINACMYTYPVHKAADILFCKADVVPVGKDQLPHLELTRMIARRFNHRYAPDNGVFPEPAALLSSAPVILGLDGAQKMSKSRNNAIMLSATEDETAALIKKAKTDAERRITYEPERRPEVANLLRILALTTGNLPEALADEIGDGGGGKLKQRVTEALNSYLEPIRARRAELAAQPNYIREVLERGNQRAREVGGRTLDDVRRAMNMRIS
jgi:tryptophanyl-tRNA synthetase